MLNAHFSIVFIPVGNFRHCFTVLLDDDGLFYVPVFCLALSHSLFRLMCKCPKSIQPTEWKGIDTITMVYYPFLWLPQVRLSRTSRLFIMYNLCAFVSLRVISLIFVFFLSFVWVFFLRCFVLKWLELITMSVFIMCFFLLVVLLSSPEFWFLSNFLFLAIGDFRSPLRLLCTLTKCNFLRWMMPSNEICWIRAERYDQTHTQTRCKHGHTPDMVWNL